MDRPQIKLTTACCLPVDGTAAETAQRFAPLGKVMGDGTRLGILGLLLVAEAPLCVCEIEACFDLSQPTISHHLRLLRESGLVETERRGTWVHYSLAAAGVDMMAEFAGWLGDATRARKGITA